VRCPDVNFFFYLGEVMTGYQSKKAAAQNKLAQPAQEALKLALDVLKDLPGFRADIDNAITAIEAALAQPAQEPVTWAGVDFDINTAPPQRPWVDLTRTQIQDVYFAVLEKHRGGHQMQGQLYFGEALQAAIKEKNK
jgi:hypothetical protein